MKNQMIQVMAILLLAISSASFASASETRHNHANDVAEKQSQCASSAEQGTKDSKRKSGERSQQEREFDRVLMGIYG